MQPTAPLQLFSFVAPPREDNAASGSPPVGGGPVQGTNLPTGENSLELREQEQGKNIHTQSKSVPILSFAVPAVGGSKPRTRRRASPSRGQTRNRPESRWRRP